MSDRPPDLKRNPYPVPGPFGAPTGWKWFDEYGTPCQILYPTQAKALKGLLDYSEWLDNGPNLRQRIWWPIRYSLWPAIVRFWNDQGHAAGKRHVNQSGAVAKGDIVGRDKIDRYDDPPSENKHGY